ncbi:hypothetical protein A11A3_05374 [Alcanivorax hongdengensis A-11-3]|uniref:DUF1656 domain-containing protein n=1 Tax=Alcanivorax hongdengensis A-11-3 TaxID=1177179 RepID=L0WG17_9GAMM|nr:DUF1656 domain-containing protein [Alcanivorax hongdengensis]EKF75097.1 hypothetical protein A11A3_05374 [Alcanivorax hongdengensis A-11-3]
MWLREMTLGGLLFSPLLAFALVGLVLTGLTRLAIHRLNGQQWLWKDAWFYVALFVCYSALALRLLG